MWLTIIVFILIFGLVILVHELGHFIMAKRAGIRIDEFGFGLPPRIFGIKKGETIYSINWLPLGGFVKIHGEEGKKKGDKDKKRAFYNKSVWTRTRILAAGVTMNFLLAAFLLSLVHWFGLPSVITDQEVGNFSDTKIQITQVAPESPADQADLNIGDEIKKISFAGKVVQLNEISQVQEFIGNHQGEEIKLFIQRGDKVFEKSMVPRVDYPSDEGSIGVGLARTALVSYPWYQALYQGVITAIDLTWFIITAFGTLLWQLITTGKLAMEIAGPVGIFNLTNQATQLGIIYIIQFAAIININLAIINALPFPALDGGRLLFLLIEKIKGSPINQKVESYSHLIGFFLLIALMIAITWRDIIRLF